MNEALGDVISLPELDHCDIEKESALALVVFLDLRQLHLVVNI